MRLPCLALLLGVTHTACVGGICARSPRTSPLVSPVVGGRYLYESMCDDDGLLCATIIDKAAFSFQLAEAIGSRFEAYQNTGGSGTCTAYDTCAASLPSTAACDANYGATEGCDCDGRAMDGDNFVVKATTAVSDANDIMNAVCYTNGLETTFKSIATTESDLKWQYYGTQEGVLVNYPGFLWGGCEGSTYDPRERPWYVMGATGPKDVIIILDKSGSMKNSDRMTNAIAGAQTVVNTLTNVDYVNVVTFSTAAHSENTMLVPAEWAYRQTLDQSIASINANGYTYYTKAMTLAFEITNKTDHHGFTANCSRVYVFLTDGDPTDDMDDFVNIINLNKREHDMFFLIALGSGLSNAALDNLRSAACAIDGVFIQVADSDTSALTKALGAYYQYLAMGNMIAEVQPTRWAEPFYSIPDIWGPVTTAVTPVYDKRQDPWTMIGVAAVDLPMCELVAAAEQAGWTDDQADPSEVLTRQGCACADSFTYDGKTYNSGCTTDDWSNAWCGTIESDDGTTCGICDGSTSPSGCWDECDYSGSVEGKVLLALKEASSQCFPAVVSEEGLEVLRGTETCTETVLTDEWTNLVQTASPNYGSVDGDDWVAPGYGVFPDCEDAFDPMFNSDTCNECPNMVPTCTVAICEAALADWEESTTCAQEDEIEGDGAVGVIIGCVIAGVVVLGICAFMMTRMGGGGGGGRDPKMPPATGIQQGQPTMMYANAAAAPPPMIQGTVVHVAPLQPIEARVVGHTY